MHSCVEFTDFSYTHFAIIRWNAGLRVCSNVFTYSPQTGPTHAYLYITILTAVSTLSSMYGSTVLYRAMAPSLPNSRMAAKFSSIKTLLVLINLQNLVFSILAANDLPPCWHDRGPYVRGSGKACFWCFSSIIYCVKYFIYQKLKRNTDICMIPF